MKRFTVSFAAMALFIPVSAVAFHFLFAVEAAAQGVDATTGASMISSPSRTGEKPINSAVRPAAPRQPVGVKTLPSPSKDIQKKMLPQKGGCRSVCPHCGECCTLNPNHPGKHTCPQGHTWW